MDTVVAVHNSMNENTWRQVLAWEALHPIPSPDRAPKLLRFLGRPHDLSPKARLKMLFSHPAPFDRHDWVVDRGGEEVRYVIDYYHDESAVELDKKPQHLKDLSSMKSIKVDVRPAIDSVGALMDRMLLMPVELFKGTTAYSPPPFFPTINMKSAEDIKEARVKKHWDDIQISCVDLKEKLSKCSTEEECGAASVALQRCVASVVCPDVAKDFDNCVQAKVRNDQDIEAAFGKMIQCIQLFELDSRRIQEMKKK
jgi:Cytochrome c/c1 heme lyase